MNEYNFNIEEQNGYYHDENPDNKPKKRTGLKVVASLVAMTLVSAGSIGVYRTVTEGNAPDKEISQSEDEKPEKSDKSDSSKADSTDSKETTTISIMNSIDINKNNTDMKVLTTEEVVAKVMPAVVGIKSEFVIEQQQNGNNYGGYGDFGGFGGFGDFGDIFGFGDSFGGGNYGGQTQPENAIGTGTGVDVD